MQRILIIDDNLDMCVLLSRFLTKKGYEVATASSAPKGIAVFRENPFDVVLCDYRLGSQDGRHVLQTLKALRPGTIVIMITAYGDIRLAVELIKMGAYDYINKPLIPDELLSVIEKASLTAPVLLALSEPATAPVQDSTDYFIQGGFVSGQAPATREVYRQMSLVAPTSYNVIIYGESGTGKEVAARTIHQLSPRRSKPFIAIDCGTLSKELAGSELFGHVKGAFTGALADRKGQFELANGGTLFLDEISNLPLDVQAALLRVIQERKLKRVGSIKEVSLDIRILVATNEDLLTACHQGKFREDLYHRLNEFSLTLPPLRDRPEDIPAFAQFFLSQVNQELNRTVTTFVKEVLDLFNLYNWPGNLRELRNVIRRAALLTPSPMISRQSLPLEITQLHNNIPTTLPLATVIPEVNLKDVSSVAEYNTIIQVLKKVNYNKTKAALLLKIDRKTLYNKLRNNPGNA